LHCWLYRVEKRVSNADRQNRWMLLAIVLAVALWGIYHAVGAYLLNFNPWRGLMVLACVGAFLGFWALLLFRRSRNVPPAKDE
jgi:hypothetical protein